MNHMVKKLRAFAERRRIIRERTAEKMEKEDFLLSQIDEFREKAKQLQDLLFSKEDKVQKLQEIVEEKEEKAKELSDMIEERQDAADWVVSGLTKQMDGMIQKVNERLDGMNRTLAQCLAENADGSAEQNEIIRTMMQGQSSKLSEMIDGMDEKLQQMETAIGEKVHKESVTCYRNMQALIEKSDRNLEEIKDHLLRFSSVKAMLKAIIVLTVLNCAGLAAVAACVLGIL